MLVTKTTMRSMFGHADVMTVSKWLNKLRCHGAFSLVRLMTAAVETTALKYLINGEILLFNI